MSSSAHPPSYQDGYAEDYSGGSFADDKQAHAHGLSAGQYDSSRSIADGDRYDDGMHLTPGAAGVGAGARAYGGDESDYAAGPAADRTTLSSPSMYTDPFEYSSTAPPPNVTSTRPPSSFLTCDPYARGNTRGATNLARADTLRPNDSVSAYNVPAPSIVGGAAAHGMGAYTPYGNAGGKYDSADVDPERDAYDYGHAHGGYGESAADLPLTGHASGMGYAEDEEDEAKQLGLAHSGARDKDGATLFANQTGPPPPRKSFEDEEDRNGLLGRLSRKDSVEAQIEKRRKGIGRQRWPFFSWLLA